MKPVSTGLLAARAPWAIAALDPTGTEPPEHAQHAEQAGQQGEAFDIILTPLSSPALGDIGIDETLFAVGRTEPPFDRYPPEIVADLSRRHARIFCEGGMVHLADMGSKNGTAVNGVDVRQKTTRLQDGDEIRFGRTLTFRVRLAARIPSAPTRLVSLTLQPEAGHADLQPVVITQFPFLIGKADTVFSRYRQAHPHQVDYLSRRHAHVFLKRGMPFVEDLGSTNGTFVDGKRLDEHAVALQEGALLAFGGHFFVFRVRLQSEALQADPTLTQYAAAMPQVSCDAVPPALAAQAPANVSKTADAPPGPDIEKTTFVAAPDSFLDIFCIDPAPPKAEIDPAAAGACADASSAGSADAPASQRARGFMRMLAGEVLTLFGADDTGDGAHRPLARRAAWWGGAVLLIGCSVGAAAYWRGASERAIRSLMADGDYARAAAMASGYLARHPDDLDVRAIDVEARLKSDVPEWRSLIASRQFDRAAAFLAGVRAAAANDPELVPLLRELAWIGELERFAADHERADAPIRMYADEDRIAALLKTWEEDPLGHQRAAATIGAQVPAFRETYAQALSHLRRLQGDNAVYLAAIDRLKAAIEVELRRDRPDAIDGLLSSYADKYPRLAGLEPVRADLARYLALDQALHGGRIGPLMAQLAGKPFATPVFQAHMQALAAAGRLPAPALVRRYQEGLVAWQAGDAEKALAALAALQTVDGRAWSAAVAAEAARKKALAEQFTSLERMRNAAGHADRLLAFYAALDPEEDGFFLRAVEADAAFDRARARQQADARWQQAQVAWQQYRQDGAIDDAARLDEAITASFKAQAGLLARAGEAARQALRMLRVMRVDASPERQALVAEIAAEESLQRRLLKDAGTSLSPAVVRAKLALMEGGNGER